MSSIVGRFSMLARFPVVLLRLTGMTQSVVMVGSVSALFDTEYGPLVLATIALLALLLALGAFNQRWALPPVGAAGGGLRTHRDRGDLGARRDRAREPGLSVGLLTRGHSDTTRGA